MRKTELRSAVDQSQLLVEISVVKIVPPNGESGYRVKALDWVGTPFSAIGS